MKLNFWQWLGVALIVVAIVVYVVWDKPQRDRKKQQQGPRPSSAAAWVAPMLA